MDSLEENKQLFNEYIRERGGVGILNPDRLSPGMQHIIRQLKTMAQDIIDGAQTNKSTIPGKMPTVYFDIIDDPVFNARAFTYKDKEFIGVNYGTIFLLFDLFARIFSNTNVFPGIGNPTIEVDLEPLPFLTINFEDLQSLFDSYDLEMLIAPFDEDRCQAAVDCLGLTWLYLINHEIAHLRFGHVGYHREKYGKSSIMEFDSEEFDSVEINPTYNFTRKSLEWHADYVAANNSLDLIRLNLKHAKFLIGLKKEKHSGLPMLATIYNIWVFSIWILFRLTDVVRDSKGLDISLKYPSDAQRQFQAIDRVISFLKEHGEDFKQEVITDRLLETLNGAEQALALVSNSTPDLTSFFSLYNDRNQKGQIIFMKEYSDYWYSYLRKELIPFSRTYELQ